MSHADSALHAVRRLAELRGREAERLQTELAERQAQRSRQADAVARLIQLRDGVGASAVASPVLAANCAAYKQVLVEMGSRQQDELARHDADLDLARAAFRAAANRHCALEQAADGRERVLERRLAGREQKRQDDLATQVWLRGRR